MFNKSIISGTSFYAPETVISNNWIEEKVNARNTLLPEGALKEKFGLEQRRFALDSEQASDIAAAACFPLFEKQAKISFDLLIFASGSSDMIEPATATILQYKLGLTCPAMDVKNACSSFVCGVQVANAFINSGEYKKILVVSGEKLSSIIKLDYDNKEELIKRMACLSMGDGGAAVVLEPSTTERGICYQKFYTAGQHWRLCTVPGGGSMFPHDGSKVYFEGRTAELRNVFLKEKGTILQDALKTVGWDARDLKYVFMHHVSERSFELAAAEMNLPQERFYNQFKYFGNMAASSIPFSLACADAEGLLSPGDKIMFFGLASGISISVQLIIW